MESDNRERYQDVPWLMSETDKLYARIVEKWPEKEKLSFTAQKMIECRGWDASKHLIRKNLPTILAEHDMFFIPKAMAPGPCFVFPLRNIKGGYTYAQTKPLEGSVLGTRNKYRFIGTKTCPGPQWLGSSPDTLRRIIRSRSVVVVEGPFDFIACRALSPDTPLLCPLTKRLGQKHVAYLRMLGVDNLYLMYDNEVSGRGNAAMAYEERSLAAHFRTESLLCPASDPSEALKSAILGERLRGMLLAVRDQTATLGNEEWL